MKKITLLTVIIICLQSNLLGQKYLSDNLNYLQKGNIDAVDFLKYDESKGDINVYFKNNDIQLKDYPVTRNIFLAAYYIQKGGLIKNYYSNIIEGLNIYSKKDSEYNDSLATSIEKKFFISNNFLRPISEKTTTTMTKQILFWKNITKYSNTDTVGYYSTFFTDILLKIMPEDINKIIDSLNSEITKLRTDTTAYGKDIATCKNSLKENNKKISELSAKNDSLQKKAEEYNKLLMSLIKNPKDTLSAILKIYTEKINKLENKNKTLRNDTTNYIKEIKEQKQKNKILAEELKRKSDLLDTFQIKSSKCEEKYKRLDSLLKISDTDYQILNQIDSLKNKIEDLKNYKFEQAYSTSTKNKELILTINYSNNLYIINKEKQEELLKLIDTLKQTKYEKIIIVGYSSETGSNEYNLLLSELRAKTVQVFLFDNGIDINNTQIISVGEFSEDKNRKVDIYIVK